MEEIKSYANAAKQIYLGAIEQAKHQKGADKTRLHAATDEMDDAAKTLTAAVQAVEGPGASIDSSTPPGASVDLTA